ncbi:hypothetical protein SEVIR_1G314500v4 [Setaria viridis]|uniref:NAC domain-containing protein n=1 Tax=Setaria viridis TaxID=4556 RepID=A0A4U6WF63_SETVI|nr:SUPPRESSOR OF GAMMA RESPONSE 1-like [Setaria viridis]TKW41421.1 hypothetical protein SEVIR_1G314500v2 [Setaria viridis]
MASKIKNASGPTQHTTYTWNSNPTKECPKCNHIIDNSDIVDECPGLPKGVKFDPSDQELLWHLLAKIGKVGVKPHPFIDEFIPTIDSNEGLCYIHPQKLPGVKQDGSVSHFFHRTFKAYSTGTKKRRKINTDELVEVRWNKTGKTKPVVIGGTHLGCKKIMVMYASNIKGGKQEKTNWVMHQYHVGTGEDEKDGEFVVSKLFYQQQPKAVEKNSEGMGELLEPVYAAVDLAACPPLMDWSALPFEEGNSNQETVQKSEHNSDQTNSHCEVKDKEDTNHPASEKVEDQDSHPSEDPKWWEGESQFLMNSQQLAECMSICDEFLQSQNSSGSGDEPGKSRPCLAEYAQLPADDLKKDIEECQKLADSDNTNMEPECTPEFRLSQLDCFATTWFEGKI